MKLSTRCIRCVIERQEERIRNEKDENKKSSYLKKVAGIIADSSDEASAPYLTCEINKVYGEYFGGIQDYSVQKREFNTLMLEMEKQLEESIGSGRDSLRHALNYARSANYIDFGAMEHVEKDKLFELLDRAKEEELDEDTYQKFTADLGKAGSLVYLTDNCGEIVADKLLIKTLLKQYPALEITVIVRGMPVLNDATLEDARMVGLTGPVKVIDNGNGVAGTQMELLSGEAYAAVHAADLIISKGQGNFETVHGCGLNIYYLFLCKCQWFVERFGMEHLKGVFINEMEL